MKRISILFIALFLISLTALAEGRAKYVFFFIGDGMGVNQVNATETYKAAIEGRIGTEPLLFASFPYGGLVTTFSATNGVTDSAAAGTALATGRKTMNGALGVLADLTTPITSIAAWAHDAGAAVGISTSVSVDHATPGAFYAHQAKRGSYNAIGKDLVKSDYDFFAGSDFQQPRAKGAAETDSSLYDLCQAAGYTVARGYRQYQKQHAKAERFILLQPENASNGDRTCLPYAIDRTKNDLTLPQITRTALSFLLQKQGEKEGFFLMVEGGKIDYACHANDAATAIREVMDMDDAIRVAYEFYEQHPDETLIVVSADHETGGIVLGRGRYELHTDLLRNQKVSAEQYTRHLSQLHTQLGSRLTWERMQQDLKEYWGFFGAITLTDHQTDRLRRAYDAYIAGTDKGEQSLYTSLDGISSAACRTMAEQAHIGWQSGGHSNGYVPVFAIGVGAEQFTGRIDNTSIPKAIAAAAGWNVPEE